MKNKSKMMRAIEAVKMAINREVYDLSIEEQIFLFQELSDWATSREQVLAFHPDLTE